MLIYVDILAKAAVYDCLSISKVKPNFYSTVYRYDIIMQICVTAVDNSIVIKDSNNCIARI